MRNNLERGWSEEAFEYCHLNIYILVSKEILSPEAAIKISLNDFENSALSDPLIFSLVKDEVMPVELALTLPSVAVTLSAISNPSIYRLVEGCWMLPAYALAIPREEVEDPITYLQNIQYKSAKQLRKLALYENLLDITPKIVEMIVMLEFSENRMPRDDRLLQLLLNQQTRHYAFTITIFEFFLPHTDKNLRELELLYDVNARDYANEIAGLEFLKERTAEQDIALESLYLHVCCKIPYETFAQKMLKKTLEEEGVIQTESLQSGCGVELRFGPAVPLSLTPFGIFSTNSRASTESLKAHIDRAIRKTVIPCYFEVTHVPANLRGTEHMHNYVNIKVALLRYGIVKYFTSSTTPEFSDDNLNKLIEILCEKIRSKTLALNCYDEIMDLKTFCQTDNRERSFNCVSPS